MNDVDDLRGSCTGRIAADGHDFVDSWIVEAFPQDAVADHSCCPENDDFHDVPPALVPLSVMRTLRNRLQFIRPECPTERLTCNYESILIRLATKVPTNRLDGWLKLVLWTKELMKYTFSDRSPPVEW